MINPSLLSEKIIVAHFLGFNLLRGITIIDPSTASIIAWIRCGLNVTIDEAHTQDWSAKALRDAGVSDRVRRTSPFHASTAAYYGNPIGYIAAEYIDGIDCDSNDVRLVAKAV